MAREGKLIIHKFGGSCLANEEAFAKTLEIIKKFSSIPTVVVLSAFKGVTDKLIDLMTLALENIDSARKDCDKLQDFHLEMVNSTIKSMKAVDRAKKFLNETFNLLKTALTEIYHSGLPGNIRDYVVSFGERISTYLFTCFLDSEGMSAMYFSGDELLTTTSSFGNALPMIEETKEKVSAKLVPVLKKDILGIVTGYYGEDVNREITTLGRGGSDFTATILANSLADLYEPEVMFWKDVDGLLTANPKIETDARLIKNISYAEAMELAYFGSKVLHPLCLRMIRDKSIPALIRNFHVDIEKPYTRISTAKEKSDEIVKAIACLEHVEMITVEGAAMVSLPGIAARIFDLMAQKEINILFISQASSENNITFIVKAEDGNESVETLKNSEFFGKRWFDILKEDASLIAIVGHGMAYSHGIAGMIFTALGDARVNVRAIAQGSTELNISIIISPSDLTKAVHAIHSRFKLQES
ncbi:MAG: aspartate kinase [Candidatus Hodarchaeota archaeon]